MKSRKIYLLLMIFLANILFSQVGIGTANPRGALDINKETTNNMGLVLPTNSDPNNMVHPKVGEKVAVGTIMYDSTLSCVRVYKPTGWSGCLCDQCGTPTPGFVLDCTSGSLTGTYTAGTMSNGTKTINYSNATGQPYNAISVASTGVTGLTATAPAGTLTGNGNISLTISGTPSAAGLAYFAITVAGQSCAFTVNVNSGILTRRTILSLGDGIYTPRSGSTTAPTTILQSPANFGPTGTVPTQGFDIKAAGSAQGNLAVNIETYNPYMIIFTWDYTSNAADAIALKDYLDKGGRVMIFLQQAQPNQLLDKIFGGLTVNNPTISTGLVKRIANVNHPILNGPFGDARGLLVGDDNDDASSYSNSNITSSNVDILATNNGKIVGFVHKTYKLFFWGDGGFPLGAVGNTSTTSYPAGVDAVGKPIPKTNYGTGTAASSSVYNSILYANAIAWMIQ
ncbi:hypothetical protein C1637_04240 [Chryseobacterium lactis]|uniref:Uncharacterized protein n=1 Tax=Chryseobacterium lactis TaxID=1241981 RepID=A0A3G6RUS4_CHRLC|nr:hypothetical protein [Chryseobacterium lactis]AZA81790.1 hypothetical protein EG342_07630 [Chryseobacterium lactis]AZB06787.1 hypothetical protein EG341_23745 [Chryseobacterium lactis]PNW15640.1 hypothetical protein C1637_04240 [Chryseobacterium lactis]